ncbi:diguanylate cyclase [Paenibacillus sp. PL2-23]|uniref:diguanylate cyclase n=1 Tax=Paenibacillus sp. PL2-23 TaxID=2100729 RepID=UPI0030F8C452
MDNSENRKGRERSLKILNTLQDLIANFAIVTAYLFLVNQVILRKQHKNLPSSYQLKLQVGFMAGILGIILMVFTVKMNGTYVDFRQIAIILAAMFGGIIPAVLSGLIIGGVRLLAFGEVTTPTIVAAANTLVIAMMLGMIGRSSMSFWSKWTWSLLVCSVMTSAVFVINTGYNGMMTSAVYITMMALGGVFTAYLNEFLIKAKAQFEKIEREATVDYLTGLNNHRTFDERYQSLLQSATEKNECLSIALVDIDFFKRVNDQYGHGNGDLVLKQLGEILMKTTRSFDTVSRNGGEEFSVIMYDTPHKHSLQIAERLRHAVSRHRFRLNDGRTIPLTVSIGVATYPDTERELLLDDADKALYAAKLGGRNTVCSNQTSQI